MIDIEAVALVGRDASGRGMRFLEVAHLFKFTHLVADGGRGEGEFGQGGKRLGTDRLGRADVFGNDRFENLLFAFGKLHFANAPLSG